MLHNKRILLIITGGIAAYKVLEVIRRIKDHGGSVRCILTEGGSQFVTPLSVSSLSGEKVYSDLWSLTDEAEMGHIRLSREADIVLVAPASANTIAKMAHGLADDLASTALLATDKPVMIAPAMNPMMWNNKATQANLETLRERGTHQIGPNAGDMACGETGPGRMAEPDEIIQALKTFFGETLPLSGKKALVTSGPTYEPIDPVRFIGNHSSGKQGHAIARALADAGAETTLVTGPTALPPPANVSVIPVETAREMLAACENALPTDIAVCAAAVADWHVANAAENKIKKTDTGNAPVLKFAKNPDILATLSRSGNKRPQLVIGFAAETESLIDAAGAKLNAKGCDWIVANDVSRDKGTFGGDKNHVFLLSRAADGQNITEEWEPADKQDIANRLAGRIAEFLKTG